MLCSLLCDLVCTFPPPSSGEGVQCVKCFLPHADEETIRTVIRSKGNEVATVKQLLAMGYPIKKQTVDVLPIHT